MADITVVVEDRGLLRGLVKLVPLEKVAATLRRRVEVANVLKMNSCSKFFLVRKMKKAELALTQRRAQLDALATQDLPPIGFFVTFEHERTVQVAMDLWKPNASKKAPAPAAAATSPAPTARKLKDILKCCGKTKARKITWGQGRVDLRLRAYEAPLPQNVMYENLPVRFKASTKARRCCSTCILFGILICSMVIAILAVQAKKMANTFSTRLHDVMGIDTSLPAVLESLNSSTPITSIGPGNTCTNESSALLTAQLSEPIDLIRDLAAAWDAGGLTTDLLQLLVALLNCWAVPAMLCTLRLLEPHAHPNVCACLHLCAHAA